MATTAAPTDRLTVADLMKRLDGIPASRVRLRPAPGTATETDLLAVLDREGIDCELIDGVLVEKVKELGEERVRVELMASLGGYLRENNLGIAAGQRGTLKLRAGLVRIPDISFLAWDRLPGGKPPAGPIPLLAPDLAAEVVSKYNASKEMRRKLRDYFDAGTRLVWFIDPKSRTARVFTAVNESVLRTEDEFLDGGEVLPGFRLSLRTLFDLASRGPGP